MRFPLAGVDRDRVRDRRRPGACPDGRGVFRAREAFASPLLAARQARAGIGQRADGRLVLVVAEGGRFGYSVGLSNFELACAVRLGAVTGSRSRRA